MSGWRGWLEGGRGRRLIDRLAAPGDAMADALFEAADAASALVDAEHRLLRTNAALRILGAAVEDAAPFAALFAEADRAAADDAMRTALGGAAPGSAPAVRLAGAAGTFRLTMRPLREADGTVSGAVAVLADIGDEVRLEARLRCAQRMQAVGEFAGGIAHDFNNLLQAVRAAAEAVGEHGGLDGEVREDLAQIQASVTRGAALVRQLLAFGRQQALQPRVLAVNDAVEGVARMLRPLLGETVRVVVEAETPGRAVRVDPSQFDQVLVNLAVNARDAMPQGGMLTLRTGHRTLLRPTVFGTETVPPGRWLAIEAGDTGCGIPPDILPRIFEPFFTTKRDGDGSGLGLATVHGIIRQSGGYLSVLSTVGRGTCFTLLLPRCDTLPEHDLPAGDSEEDGSATAAASVPQSRTVLLVEDEEPVRRLAARTLARRGWRVLAAESGEEALALLGESPPALAAIVTDMVMPGMDGAALVRAVRARLAAPDLPAIVVSGYAEAALRGEMEATATAFLPKPYSLKDLSAKLAAVAG